MTEWVTCVMDGNRITCLVLPVAFSGVELVAAFKFLVSDSIGGMAHPLGHVTRWFSHPWPSCLGFPRYSYGGDLMPRSEGRETPKGLRSFINPLELCSWLIWNGKDSRHFSGLHLQLRVLMLTLQGHCAGKVCYKPPFLLVE